MCIRQLLFLLALARATAAEPPLQLHELIDEALQHNPEILAAQKRLEEARARPAQQAALPDPTVSFGWNSNGNPLPGAGLGSAPTANIGVMASQEFPWPGKLRLRADIARDEAGAEAEQYRAVELSVVSRLKQAYHRLHHTYVMQELLEQNRDLLRNLLSVTEARYSVGKTPQQDIFKAQTQLSMIETRVIQMERDRHAREAEINSLLNRRPESALGRPPDEPAEPLGFTLEELEAKAGEAAPELRRDQKMLSAPKRRSTSRTRITIRTPRSMPVTTTWARCHPCICFGRMFASPFTVTSCAPRKQNRPPEWWKQGALMRPLAVTALSDQGRLPHRPDRSRS